MTTQTVSSLIDDVTKRLGDSATIVSRAEIKDWIADGYARMVRDARTPAKIEVQDVPPRHSFAITHEWEREYVDGTARKFTYTHFSGLFECTYLWEVSEQFNESTTDYRGNATHLWELEYFSGGTDSSYTFSIPRRQDLLSVWYDHDVLLPLPGRSFEGGGNWWDNAGLPSLFSADHNATEFDLYRIVTSNNHGYDYDRPIGIPRRLSGDRTYEIDSDTTNPFGVIRFVRSPDRQYHNSTSWERSGTIRAWGSSEDNLLVYSSVEPERDLDENAPLTFVPGQLCKYIVFYALSMIHDREGELYEPNMAEHYRMRFRRGVFLLNRIRNMGFRDVEYSREERRYGRSIRTPQLPDNYPRLRLR
jgi:hypothetical protein